MKNIEIVSSGDLYFEKLWNLIDNSQVCCWIITYHMNKSFIADETLRRLINAAERGVDIVVFVDWLNYYLDGHLVKRLHKAGATVKYLNSMNLKHRSLSDMDIFTKHIFKRHHEKLALIDDTVVVTSANFDSEYGESKYGNNKFFDMSMFIKGKCVKASQDFFFNVAKIYGFDLKTHDLAESANNDLLLVYSEPYYFYYGIQEMLLNQINSAKSRIILAHGYFFHIKKVHKALKRAVNRGVKIELITSKNRDQLAYKDLINSKIAKKFLGIGGRVFEMTEKVFHTKMYIIDHQLILGSFNNDKWSWSMNSEIMLFCKNRDLTKQAFQIIENLRSELKEVKRGVKANYNPFAWFWRRFLTLSEHVMNTKKNYKYFILHSYVDDVTNPIEERHAIRMRRIESFKVNTASLNMVINF